MKTLTKLSRVAIVLIFVFAACKPDNPKPTPVPTTNNNPGFTYNGTTFNGTWLSITDVGAGGPLGNIDVLYTAPAGSGVNDDFIFYNMPMQNGGAYTFTNGLTNSGSSQLYALAFLGNPVVLYYSTGGTVTKTGTNSFTFSCIMGTSGSTATVTVTGQGSY